MKKILSVTLVLALLLLIFAGCQSSDSQLQQPGGAVSGQGSATAGDAVPDETPAKEITADEAKAAALEHALLKASEVTGLTAQYGVDDGVAQYEVDFRQGDYDYDYEIDAVTGKVLSFDKEYEPVAQQPAEDPQPTEEPKPEGNNQNETKEKLTEAEAKAAALKHAGLKEKDVTGLRVKYEVDDGVPRYDVDFRHGDYEYGYEIHAKTGKVISYDKDYDPADVPAGGTAAKVTADEAKAIALKHAGLKEKDVTRLQVEYDGDDRVKHYDVEFQQGKYEYSYEINAETGKIIQSEKELDD